MARRTTKAERNLFIAAIVIGLPIFAVAKFFDALGTVTALSVIIGATALVFVAFVAVKKQKRASLLAKYGDPLVVERILNKTLWVGETSAQLIDSLGAPLEVDRSVLKTKTKETWKYLRKSAKRYGLRVTLENGIVVGWDAKP
ncbi:MAG TPA: hypothetical protein VKV39_17035 [Candidatus Sulfotelmatobacter sp.]|nr:hypothetical protein [Candidatus Sulfotelmatobacter sp.]